MAKVAITEQYLTDIADAIRSKTSSVATYKPSEMAQAISDISGGTVNLKDYIIRPDAELVLSDTYDAYAVADEELTIPAYSTTASTIKTYTNLSTYTIDPDNYLYQVLVRMMTIPTYNVATKGKGRIEYFVGAQAYELIVTPAGEVAALLDGTANASSYVAFTGTKGFNRITYWSTASAVALYNSAAYGFNYGACAPAISGTKITLRSPYFTARGNTTYFTSTYMGAVTDVRLQYKVELYRTPKGNLNIDGWEANTQADHLYNCIASTSHKLT